MELSFSKVGIVFFLAMLVACITWTVTHEEVFREVREKCQERSRAKAWYVRKFYYVFTCEYCFSHYVSLLVLALPRFKFLVNDWRGYVLAFFTLIWIANQYMSLYNRLRLDIKTSNLDGEIKESTLKTKRTEDAHQVRNSSKSSTIS